MDPVVYKKPAKVNKIKVNENVSNDGPGTSMEKDSDDNLDLDQDHITLDVEAQDYEFLGDDEQFIDDSDVESDDDQNVGQVAQVTDSPASVRSYQYSAVGLSCRPKTFQDKRDNQWQQ